jgi:hypothetical protein
MAGQWTLTKSRRLGLAAKWKPALPKAQQGFHFARCEPGPTSEHRKNLE